MDIGIYSLNACRFLTGEEPAEVKGYASVIDHDGRFNEVEENLAWTMRFPSGVMATCNTSYGASLPGFYRVHGTKGMMHVEPAFGYDGLHLTANINGQPHIDEPNPEKDPAQFPREADHLADCIIENREPKTAGEEGLRDMKLMSAIYKSCGRPSLERTGGKTVGCTGEAPTEVVVHGESDLYPLAPGRRASSGDRVENTGRPAGWQAKACPS